MVLADGQNGGNGGNGDNGDNDDNGGNGGNGDFQATIPPHILYAGPLFMDLEAAFNSWFLILRLLMRTVIKQLSQLSGAQML